MARLKKVKAAAKKGLKKIAKKVRGKTPKKASKKDGGGAVRLDEYDLLARKVDEFFTRVHDRYRSEMQCASGCSECCGHHLTISVVEAESMAHTLATRDVQTRARLAARAAALGDGEGPCPALEDDGRCGVYEGRPLVCRSHGAPMYTGSAALPVLKEGDVPEEGDEIKCCHLNFPERQLDQVDPDCVLDLVNMAATLAVVNARATPNGQSEALRRIKIGDVLLAAHSR